MDTIQLTEQEAQYLLDCLPKAWTAEGSFPEITAIKRKLKAVSN